MTASRPLYGETRHMHCSGVILAHSSSQSSNLEGSVAPSLIFSFYLSYLFYQLYTHQ